MKIMVLHDRLSLKLELLKAAENDVQRYKKLYALVEEEAKSLPAVMDSKEYIQADVEGAGKIVKEMMAEEHERLFKGVDAAEGNIGDEAMAMGLAALSSNVAAKEEEVTE